MSALGFPEQVASCAAWPPACGGLSTSAIVGAASPMMSYLSIVLFDQIVPCEGAPAIGDPGPSQLIGKSLVLPCSALSALQTWEPLPTPLMPESEQTYVGSVQLSETLAGRAPLIQSVSILAPPD